MFLDVALAADDAVRADAGASFYDGAFVDEARTFDQGALFDACALRDPGIRRSAVRRSGSVRGVTAVHDVAMDLHVLIGRADVDPVAPVDVGHKRFSAFDERRKEAALDRPRHVLRDAIEGVGFEDVDARVDRVARDLVRLGLFEKPFDVAALVGFRDVLQEIELIVEKRPIENWNDRFGRVDRQRPQPRALAPREQNRLHANRQCYHLNRAIMNLPNALTVMRICLVPLLVVVLLTKFEGRQILGVPVELVGAAIFGLASLTDWADGYFARRRKQITPFGQYIDPLADKLLTVAAFVSLVQMDLAPAWMVAVIIGREVARTALRRIFYARGVPIPASPLGKIKMIAQVVAIIALILGQHGQAQAFFLHRIGQVALWVVVIAALVSAADYFRRFNLLLNARVNSTPGAPAPRSISAARDNRQSEPRRESA